MKNKEKPKSANSLNNEILRFEENGFFLGSLSKVALETEESEVLSAFALAHGTDMCDPMIGTVCGY